MQLSCKFSLIVLVVGLHTSKRNDKYVRLAVFVHFLHAHTLVDGMLDVLSSRETFDFKILAALRANQKAPGLFRRSQCRGNSPHLHKYMPTLRISREIEVSILNKHQCQLNLLSLIKICNII